MTPMGTSRRVLGYLVGRVVEGLSRRMNGVSLPVGVLTGLGALVVLLGLFAAGEVALVIVGLASIAAAGILHVLEGRGS